MIKLLYYVWFVPMFTLGLLLHLTGKICNASVDHICKIDQRFVKYAKIKKRRRL